MCNVRPTIPGRLVTEVYLSMAAPSWLLETTGRAAFNIWLIRKPRLASCQLSPVVISVQLESGS